MTLSETDARALASEAFRKAGADLWASEACADALVLAEMMGIRTHGLSRVRVYLDRIAAGGIDPLAQPVLRAPASALRHIDGRNALGPATARRALDEGMAAARQSGVGAVFCRGANHLGALAPYLWRATGAGFVCLITTNTAPMIAPAGGRFALSGNNPLGIGIPNPGGDPVLFDMALSVVARSRVRAAAREGRAIPETWASDVHGRPTDDPAAAMQGLMQAIGGAKGATLALCLDLLAAGLSGAAMMDDVPDTTAEPGVAQDLGQMFLLIDAQALMPAEGLSSRMGRVTERVERCAPVDPDSPVRLPGARAIASMRRAQEGGLDIEPATLADLRRLADA